MQRVLFLTSSLSSLGDKFFNLLNTCGHPATMISLTDEIFSLSQSHLWWTISISIIFCENTGKTVMTLDEVCTCWVLVTEERGVGENTG